MTGGEIVETVRANYLRAPDYAVRHGSDEAGCAWLLVRVQRNEKTYRLFGLGSSTTQRRPPRCGSGHPRDGTTRSSSSTLPQTAPPAGAISVEVGRADNVHPLPRRLLQGWLAQRLPLVRDRGR